MKIYMKYFQIVSLNHQVNSLLNINREESEINLIFSQDNESLITTTTITTTSTVTTSTTNTIQENESNSSNTSRKTSWVGNFFQKNIMVNKKLLHIFV